MIRPNPERSFKLLVLGAAWFLIAACNPSGIQVARMPSGSMEPTFAVNERFFWKRLSEGQRKELRVGDLVVHILPNDPKVMMLRRLVGRGGDTVEIRGDKLLVNGHSPDAKWATHDCSGIPCSLDPVAVPAGREFVIGDKWENSRDSRSYGTIETTLVVGKVILKE